MLLMIEEAFKNPSSYFCAFPDAPHFSNIAKSNISNVL